MPPIGAATARGRIFADGTWGGSFHPDFEPQPGDVVAQEHWLSSGFANTDLDLQLKKHGVRKVIVIGMRANTCIESTVRYAVELGYEVTSLGMRSAASARTRWRHRFDSMCRPTRAPSSRRTNCLQSSLWLRRPRRSLQRMERDIVRRDIDLYRCALRTLKLPVVIVRLR